MSGSFIGLRSSWRRARKQLSGALPILKARVALAKANEDLKTAQAELQRRWQYLAEAQRLSHSGTFAWKVSNGELVWSNETYKILGFARETNPTIDLVFDRIHPEDRERLQQLRDRAAQNGMDLDFEHRILLPDGVIRYVHVVAHAGEDHSGDREYIGIVSDITERKRAEEERQALSRDLKESNARLEEAQRVAHVGYWEWDLETGEVIWSDETYRIFGLKPQERPMDLAMVRGMVHPEDREALYSGVDVELDAGVHPVAEFRIVTPSGEVRTVHAITSKLWSALPGDPDNQASGKARKLFGTVQDVTELKRAEKAHHAVARDLRESKAWLEEAQRVAHLGHWVWDLETSQVIWSEDNDTTIYVNPATGQSVTESYADRAVPNNGGGRDRPNTLFDPRGNRSKAEFFNTAAFAPQPTGEIGNTPRNSLFGPDFRHVDLSLFKNFAVTERVNLQFRAEAYNISNTPRFIFPLGDGSTELGSTNFGVVSNFDPSYTPHLYQFALKAQF